MLLFFLGLTPPSPLAGGSPTAAQSVYPPTNTGVGYSAAAGYLGAASASSLVNQELPTASTAGKK